MRKRPVLFILITVLLLGIAVGEAYAQGPPPDRIQMLYFNYHKWPSIPFKFDVYCNNEKTYEYDAIRVYEDGELRIPLVKNCEDYYYHGNLGFIVDRSGSQETQLNGIKEGLKYFVEHNLSGSSFVASFAEDAVIDLAETNNKGLLKKFIDTLVSHGMTLLWEGVEICLEASKGNVKDVLLITDGDINGGRNVAFRAVEKAKLLYTRIHVLSIGSVSPAKDTLKMVADKTGGKFLHIPKGTYPDNFVSGLGTWFRFGTFKDSVCSYEHPTHCADGQRHEVVIEVDACGKTLREVIYYDAPLDPSLPHVTAEIGNAKLYYGQTAELPVRITDVYSPNYINYFSFEIYVPEAFEILGVTKEGCALERIPGVEIEIAPPKVRVKCTEQVRINPVVTELFKIRVAVSDDLEKEANVELEFVKHAMRLDQCSLYQVKPGAISGYKKGFPKISCAADSIHVQWNIEESRYEPEILELRATVENPTPIAVSNPYVTITVPKGLELIDGPATRPIANGSLLSTEQVVFRVRPLATDYPKSFTVCFEAGGDSTESTTCCTKITLDASTPYLKSWCEIPSSVSWDSTRAAYVPEDFPVTVRVVNKGKIPARNIELSIEVPESCMLRSWYRPVVPLTPADLMPGDTGSYTWKVVPLAHFAEAQEEIHTTVTVLEVVQEHVCSIFVPVGYPRAELVCGNAKSLYYNDTTKKYSPDLFAVSADFENTSRLPIWHVRAELELPPFLHFQPGDGPVKMLDMDPLWPGVKRKIYWLLYADGPPIDGAEVCMKVYAPSYPGDSCCIPIRTRNTVLPLPELICDLDLPDTIRYTDDGYEPNPFVVDVSVLNLGDTAAGMVYTALHQGSDLSIASGDDALKLLATELGVIEEATTTFTLDVLRRTESRWDTVRISVYSENGGAVVCEKRIWIEAIRGPVLDLQCTGPDSLKFDDATLSYQPSPFQVYLTATNTGTAAADSVIAEYLAGPNMELVSGDMAVKPLSPSRLGVAESGTAQWSVRAVPRAVASVDTIWLQATTKQELLQPVVPCPVAIYVPAARSPELRLTCEPPSAVAVDGQRYLPDPLTFRLQIQSTGTAVAYDVRAEAVASSRLVLASSDTKMKTVPSLAALQGVTEFTWDYHPVPSTLGDTVTVTFRVEGRFMPEVYCTTKLYLPPVPPAIGNTQLDCTGPDTLRGDEYLRRYPNPVAFQSQITNTGTGEIDTVVVTIHPPTGVEFAAGEPGYRTLTGLRASEKRAVEWELRFIEDTSTVLKDRNVRVRVVSLNDLRYCDMNVVVVPFNTAGRRTFALTCNAPDTIRYDAESRALTPEIFPVRVSITNTGAETLSDVTAVLAYPGRFLLAEGETVQKHIESGLAPGDSVEVQWQCSAVLRPAAGSAPCTITVSALGAQTAECTTTTLVEGHTSGVSIEVASGNVVGYEQTVRVPVFIQNPGAESFTDFRHTIVYDSKAVSLVDVANTATLTEYWQPPSHEEEAPGRVTVIASGDAPVSDSGILYYLVFTGTSDAHYSPFDVVSSMIDITGPEEVDGTIVSYISGDITTSGSCVVPLEAGEGYVLAQNTPNPFNPVTTITYHIPRLQQPVETVVEVLDVYGRTVRRYDEGRRNDGTFTVQFDASGLQSGMYFYRLQAGHYIATRKMVYMK